MSIGGGGETKATAQETGLAQTSKKRYLDYQARFQPLEKAFLNRTAATEGTRGQAAGIANADVRIDAKGGNATGNPYATADRNIGAAQASGLSQGYASTAVDTQALGAKQKVISNGQGLASNYMAGTTNSAQNATRQALADAKNDYAISQGIHGGVGLAGGAYARHKYGPLPTRITQ